MSLTTSDRHPAPRAADRRLAPRAADRRLAARAAGRRLAPRAADRCLAARAALAGGRLVGDAGVCRAVRQAVDGCATAETEIPVARIADRPAACAFGELGERTARSGFDRFLLDRRRRLGPQRRQNVMLGHEPQRHLAPRRPRPHGLALESRQLQAVELADDGVAAHADLVGDLAARQAGGKATPQLLDTLDSPRPSYAHGDDLQLRVTTFPFPASFAQQDPVGRAVACPVLGSTPNRCRVLRRRPSGRRGGLMFSAMSIAWPKAKHDSIRQATVIMAL